MRRSTRRTLAAAAVGAAGLGLLGGTTAAATPFTTTAWHDSGGSWDDPNDAGGVSVYEKTSDLSAGGGNVLGQFFAYGEKISIIDHHDNGRRAIVKLWVGKSGPAVFYGNGDGTERIIDESYDEGQTVKIQVCTSTSAKAQCSSNTYRGRS